MVSELDVLLKPLVFCQECGKAFLSTDRFDHLSHPPDASCVNDSAVVELPSMKVALVQPPKPLET